LNVDAIRTIFTYAIGLVVIVGGGALLVIPSRIPPEQLLPFLTGTIGLVLGFVFQERSSASTAKQTEAVIHATAATTANGTSTSAGGTP
jgi:hypothetical protein